MKLLFIQETNWLTRYPAQQHHLAELMTLRGYDVRAIDYDLTWRINKPKGLISRREVLFGINKIHEKAGITLIRPAFIKLPILDYISMAFSHYREIRKQIDEFHLLLKVY